MEWYLPTVLGLRPRHLAPWPLLMALTATNAQTVVLNEVSNGPAGNQEYMELVVVPDGAADPCQPVPCLDLRGWIIDDNNGYHGAGGVAPGAARFADHPLWSCVPIGTMILIYNGGDPNGSIPADDLSVNDGNCTIIVPVGEPGYFERTTTTPAPVACSDPGGWTPTAPNWNGNMAFANTGDCARVADPSGCEVFSLCYGNTTQNASVAFAGAGGQKVWWFNAGDPHVATNWSTGCAAAGSCGGANDQSPGMTNNAANAAWVAQFNNNCSPVPFDPLVADAQADPACGCNGTATATASGSQSPYTFIWYDAGWNPTGEQGTTADELCGGTYHVITTSSTGCQDTASVEVLAVAPVNAGSDATLDLCADAAAVDLFGVLGGTPDPGGSWSPALPAGLFDPSAQTPGTFTYTVSGTAPCPDASATVTVTISAAPSTMVTTTDVSCSGASDGGIAITTNDPGPHVFQWSSGLPDGPVQTGLEAGTYTVEVSGPAGCSTTLEIDVNAPGPLVLAVTTTPALCMSATGSACVSATGGTAPYTYAWSSTPLQSTACANGLAPGTYPVLVTDANGCIANTDATVGSEDGGPGTAPVVTHVDCHGEATGSITLAIDPPGLYDVSWTGPEAFEGTGQTITGLVAGAYTYEVTDANACTTIGTTVVNEPQPLTVTATATPETCIGACDGSLVLSPAGGAAPWTLWLAGSIVPPGTVAELCAGTYSVQVIDTNGCTADAQGTVIAGEPPVAIVLGPFAPLCVNGASIVLGAAPAGGTWSGAGIVDAMNGLFDPDLAGPGQHLITYTTSSGCLASAQAPIVVLPSPEADFLLPLGGDPPLVATNTSSGATAFSWTINGTAVAESHDLSWDPGEGTWSVCLIASDAAMCSDTACRTITFNTGPVVHVPNAFTPNDDAINDTFTATVHGLLDRYELLIFDRWGQVLFASSSPLSGWNGTSNGAVVPIGVYPWRLSIAHAGGQHVRQGHVTLLR